jgi:CheY-like chemotaxis protein
MWRVLCVDDDADKAAEVAEILTSWKAGNSYGDHACDVESNFERAVTRISNERFDIVTLDLHGSSDPDPLKAGPDSGDQEGKKVLDRLKKVRFVPVIFYSDMLKRSCLWRIR